MSNKRSVLREEGQSNATVGYAELFFDLVYVFAITQLSHFLLGHHDLVGVLQTTILFFATWWAWIYMTWATNWLDPDRFWVRAMIFVMMLIGLLMGSAIPKAFGEGGLLFAGAYTASQVGRTLVRRAGHAERPARGVAQHDPRRDLVRRGEPAVDCRRFGGSGAADVVVGGRRWRSNSPRRWRCTGCLAWARRKPPTSR